jgi:hypothetical protein
MTNSAGRCRLVISHNPAPGAESEFNRWLDEDHVPGLPGIRGAQRLRLALTARWPAGERQHWHMSVYTVEACDISAFHRRPIADKNERQAVRSIGAGTG